MTNERAVELLRRLQDEQFDGQHGDERREALEMAVRALEGDGDTISRKMAIDALTELREKTVASDSFRLGIYYSIEEIKNVPPAQPERQVELDGTESNIEILSELRAQFNCFDEVEEPYYRALSDAICAPTAQPQRKSARWEILYPNHTYKYHCSECGANHRAMYDYCPSCGAYMGDKSDE